MNSGASWNERGLSPELYQAAREAAQRAGMSVEEWLRATFGDSAAAAGVRPKNAGPLGARLDELSQRFGRAAEDEPGPSVRAARLASTAAKLNERLEQLTTGRPAPSANHSAPAGRSPPVAPEPFD